MKQNNHGFSLIETVVAMAILGAFSVSIATCLVLSLRMNEKTSTLMQEQMAVSSAVETLMAEGIRPEPEAEPDDYEYTITQETVTIEITPVGDKNYCNVTVSGKDGNVSVTTQIRKAVETQ